MTNTFKQFVRHGFNWWVNRETRKAQKKYRFEIGTGEHATWNNESDAFKHAYMSSLWIFNP